MSDYQPLTERDIQTVESFMDLLDGMDARLQKCLNLYSKAEDELCDLTHEIELGVFNAAQGFNRAKQMQEVLQRRRTYKDDLDLLNIFKAFLDGKSNQALRKELGSLAGNLRRIYNHRDKRKYRARVRTDLTISKAKDASN